jgi:hypothetical protein
MAYKKKKVIGTAVRSAKSSAADINTDIAPTTETPLEYMLRVMRDPSADEARRDAMAKAALPYMHGRLTSGDGQVSDDEGGTVTFTWLPAQN